MLEVLNAPSDLVSASNAAGGGVRHVLEDPALPELIRLVGELRQIQEKGHGVQSKGLGLSTAVPLVKVFVAVKRRPWLGVLGAVAILAIPFAIGRASRSR